VQGEGGVRPVDGQFVRTVRELCGEYDALLIFDEIQTGVGRCGKMYLYEKLGVTPDILTTAKGLGGGFPIGAMLTTAKIAESLAVGTHGSTFGGNPMACAVANKVLELVDSDLLTTVEKKSERLVQGLNEIGKKYNLFSEVRGEGLLLGGELAAGWKDRARDVLNACVEKGLLVLVAGDNVLRLAPALNISESDIQEGLERMDRAVEGLL